MSKQDYDHKKTFLGLSLGSFAIFLFLWITGLWRYVVILFVDLLNILAGSTVGYDIGLGFVENTLAIYPAGEIFVKIPANQMPTLSDFVLGFFQVILVCLIRAQLRPAPEMFYDYRDGRRKWNVLKFIGTGILDSIVTGAIALGVGVFTNLAFTKLLDETTQFYVSIVLLGLSLVTIILLALVALKTVTVMFLKPAQAFGFVTALGRFALVTFSLITFSKSPPVGCVVIAMTIVACALLTMIESGFPFKVKD